MLSQLQIRGGIEDNSKIIFPISQQNISCDPSLESSSQDGSNDGSQNMFLWKQIDNYPKITLLALHIWSTDVV